MLNSAVSSISYKGKTLSEINLEDLYEAESETIDLISQHHDNLEDDKLSKFDLQLINSHLKNTRTLLEGIRSEIQQRKETVTV